MDYIYVHETRRIEYTVDVSPPPASESKVVMRKQGLTGSQFDRKDNLEKVGKGKLPFCPNDSSLTIDDSPVVFEFSFKSSDGVEKKPAPLFFSLAKAIVWEIDAPKLEDVGDKKRRAFAGDKVELDVTKWGAEFHDTPGNARFTEEKAAAKRILSDVRSQTKWQIDGKDLPDTGEKITYEVKKADEGKDLVVEAFLGDKPPGRAKLTLQVVAKKDLKIVFQDGKRQPLKNADYELEVAGKKPKKGKTDGDGLLKEEVLSCDTSAKLKIGGRTIVLEMGPLKPAAELPGVRTRLRNLGYDIDAADAPIDNRTKAAIAVFQHESGVKIDGDPSAIAQKLEEAHGL